VLDSLTPEKQGIPTVTVVTKIFERPAHAQAKLAGMPDLCFAVIPDKVDWHTAEELDAIAEELFGIVVAGLTTPGSGSAES
jgi:hypothetical protein